MIQNLAIWMSLFSLIGCSGYVEGLDAPSDLIPKDKMVEVMTEMMKLETHIQLTYSRVDRFQKMMVESGDSLLRAHSITNEQYSSSFDYYASHQDQMQEIYGAVLEELNKDLGELE